MNTAERIARLNRIRNFSRLMDSAFRIPGTSFRFGWDPIIGLIPGAGDLVSTMVSAYIIYLAARFRLPPKVLLQMILNISLEAVVGAVPLVGDLFDAFYKSNLRNLALLEKHIHGVESEPGEAVSVTIQWEKMGEQDIISFPVASKLQM